MCIRDSYQPWRSSSSRRRARRASSFDASPPSTSPLSYLYSSVSPISSLYRATRTLSASARRRSSTNTPRAPPPPSPVSRVRRSARGRRTRDNTVHSVSFLSSRAPSSSKASVTDTRTSSRSRFRRGARNSSRPPAPGTRVAESPSSSVNPRGGREDASAGDDAGRASTRARRRTRANARFGRVLGRGR